MAKKIANSTGYDLRSGTAVWAPRNSLQQYPPLETDLNCDAVIVGGGITGAVLADQLSHAGLSCVLLDRRTVAAGSTYASTAILEYELDRTLVRLADQIGIERAMRVYRYCFDAFMRWESLATSLPTEIHYRRRLSLRLASIPDDNQLLEKEALARHSLDSSVQHFQEHQVAQTFSLPSHGALSTNAAAELAPVRATVSLMERAQRQGLRLFGRTSARKYSMQGNQVRVTTDTGYEVHARRVFVATGYEAQQMLPTRLVTLMSTYALATEPIEEFHGWKNRQLIWETAHPYHYFRTTADNRAIIGGEDIQTRAPWWRDFWLNHKTRKLFNRFQVMFPNIQTRPAFWWTGTFGETSDTLPYIGEHEAFPGVFFLLGFGGNGMLFAVSGAAAALNWYQTGDFADADLFAFKR